MTTEVNPNGQLVPREDTEAMKYEKQVHDWLQAFPTNENLKYLMFFHCTVQDEELEVNHTVQNIEGSKANQLFAFQCFKALTNQFMDGIKA